MDTSQSLPAAPDPPTRPESEAEHQRQREHAARLYQQDLPGQLRWALEFVEQHITEPKRIQLELHNIFVLLDHVRPHPHLVPAALAVLRALRNIPFRLGLWWEWEAHLRYALGIARAQRNLQDEAYFVAQLADILIHSGQPEQTIDLSAAAILTPYTRQTALEQVTTTTKAIDSLIVTDRLPEATLLHEHMVQQIAQLSDVAEIQPLIQAYARYSAGLLLYTRNAWIEALAEFEHGLAQINAFDGGYHSLSGALQRLISMTFRRLGVHGQARRYVRAAIETFRRDKDPLMTAIARGYLGLVYWSMGDLAHAEHAMRHSLIKCRALGAQLQAMEQVANLSMVYLAKGWLDVAGRYARRYLQQAEKHHLPSEIYRAYATRGFIAYHRGHYTAALRDLQRSAFAPHQRYLNAFKQLYMSRCHFQLGHAKRAYALAQDAYKTSEVIDSMALRISALRCLGEISPNPLHREKHLHQALQLSMQTRRQLDAAASALELASLMQEPLLWQTGSFMLGECEADAWLHLGTPDHPPRIALIG